MSAPAIKTENLGKKYVISSGNSQGFSLRESISGTVKKALRVNRAKQKEFWALRDVSINFEKGQVTGIIGKNGSGKSTLLKILSGITRPTTGSATIAGRTSSLLEVGTGFHSELSGRENIFFNGALLGMTRAEVQRKFDSIAEFSGIEDFLDTPVKHYSSGMYMRLAFSVAAHLDPEILFVDEVLAVGDAAFQKKCIGKLNEVAQNEGKTVLFVSHDLNVVQSLSRKVIYLENGVVKYVGDPQRAIDKYLTDSAVFDFTTAAEPHEGDGEVLAGKKDAVITSVQMVNARGVKSVSIPISESGSIEVAFEVKRKIKGIVCYLFRTETGILYTATDGDRFGTMQSYEPGIYQSKLTLPPFFFNVGVYRFEVSVQHPGMSYFDNKVGFQLRILNEQNPRAGIFGNRVHGPMAALPDITTKKL